MKVCCVYLQGTLGNSQNASPWLRVGEVYQVLSLERDSQGRLLVRLLLNQIPRAGLFPIEQFTIVSGKLPQNWYANFNKRGLLTLGPSQWNEPGFWERFYDDDPRAVEVFEKEVRKICAAD